MEIDASPKSLMEIRLSRSPYTPPATDLQDTTTSKFEGDPLDNPRILVWVLRTVSLLQIPLGVLGMLGVYVLLTGDAKNPETYEVIIAPIFAWIVSFPIFLLFILVYRKCRGGISTFDRLWYLGWSLLPTVAAILGVLACTIRF